MRKIVETRNPLSNTIKDTSTIMRNPLPELGREGLRMIVLVSLIVLLRGLLVSTSSESLRKSSRTCEKEGMPTSGQDRKWK